MYTPVGKYAPSSSCSHFAFFDAIRQLDEQISKNFRKGGQK
jgi:hypothetical protein